MMGIHTPIIALYAGLLGLVFLYLSVHLNTQHYQAMAEGGGELSLKDAAKTLSESTQALYWVMASIILFASYFGLQAFQHWDRTRHLPAGQNEARLFAPPEFEVDLSQQLYVEQCIVAGPHGIIDAEAAAQRVQAIRQARVFPFGNS